MRMLRPAAIALCGCALWLYAERIGRSDDGPPRDDKAPPKHQKRDVPPGPTHDPSEAAPPHDDFDSPGPPRGEVGPPGSPQDKNGPAPVEGLPYINQLFRSPQDQYGPAPRQERVRKETPTTPGMPATGGGIPGMPAGIPGGMQGGVYGRYYGMPGMPGMPGMQDPETREVMRLEADLDQRSRDLAEKYRHLSESDRGDIQKQLEKVVRDQFELRQARRQKELKRLEEQIKKLRETIEKREKTRDAIIDRRIKELLGEDDDTRF